ncbi:DUF551 domain-containing protein [Paenibacillus sp. CMAA1739]|uniref:DUF551 domain-containing protein n=1 Tax=Paenibacillus ottowii TaxID=2315729 RepID=UPI002DBD1FA7|nr:DUF551 domain-containing protein [Paenibacillus sp. CMAA1739]MEC4565538.1 DUF551 domain-containing protein [Paenibacillus sp. CMAA1739]
MEWISVKDKLPKTQQRVIARFIVTTFDDKVIPKSSVAEYIAPRTVLEEDYMNEDFAGEGDYDEQKDCFWTVSGWYESSYEADVNWRLSQEVTHWMPLPSVNMV